MEIDFRSHDVPGSLPREISLCLFRVVQEALQNAVKHRGVKQVEVTLSGTGDGIHLIVRDSGRGFEVATALQGQGLGLTNRQERIRMVSGIIVFSQCRWVEQPLTFTFG